MKYGVALRGHLCLFQGQRSDQRSLPLSGPSAHLPFALNRHKKPTSITNSPQNCRKHQFQSEARTSQNAGLDQITAQVSFRAMSPRMTLLRPNVALASANQHTGGAFCQSSPSLGAIRGLKMSPVPFRGGCAAGRRGR